MADLIDRQALLRDIKKYHLSDGKFQHWVEVQPAVEAEPVRHGKWIDMADFEQCSSCSGTRLKEMQTVYGKAIWIKTPYCPNCGARMDGGQNETD